MTFAQGWVIQMSWPVAKRTVKCNIFLQMIRNPYQPYIHENLRNSFNILRDAYKNYLADFFR